MSDYTPKQTVSPVDKLAAPRFLEPMRKKMREIEAENLSLKAERNARRWKAERDPVAYEAQKVAQRERYRLEDAKGRDVRTYRPVIGDTKEQRHLNAKARDAQRKVVERANASQDKKDAEADRKWKLRKRKAGWTNTQIEIGMTTRLAERERRPLPDEQNPNFGQF